MPLPSFAAFAARLRCHLTLLMPHLLTLGSMSTSHPNDVSIVHLVECVLRLLRLNFCDTCCITVLGSGVSEDKQALLISGGGKPTDRYRSIQSSDDEEHGHPIIHDRYNPNGGHTYDHDESAGEKSPLHTSNIAVNGDTT